MARDPTYEPHGHVYPSSYPFPSYNSNMYNNAQSEYTPRSQNPAWDSRPYNSGMNNTDMLSPRYSEPEANWHAQRPNSGWSNHPAPQRPLYEQSDQLEHHRLSSHHPPQSWHLPPRPPALPPAPSHPQHQSHAHMEYSPQYYYNQSQHPHHGYNSHVNLPPRFPEPPMEHTPNSFNRTYMENSPPLPLPPSNQIGESGNESTNETKNVDAHKIINLCDDIRLDAMKNQTEATIEAMYKRSEELHRYLSELRSKSDSGSDFEAQRKESSSMIGKYKKRNRTNPGPGRCHSCNCRETPEWRRGPDGARTLCNACGLRYTKMNKLAQKQARAANAANSAVGASPANSGSLDTSSRSNDTGDDTVVNNSEVTKDEVSCPKGTASENTEQN